jgi:universal stress protein E
MKVLIATDGSNDANTAIVTALRLLRSKDLSVDVLCVARELVRASCAEGSATLAVTERFLHHEGLAPHATLKVGSPADVIAKSASDYDLVVVGAHGKHERTQPGLGPVSAALVENVRGNLMVGRELVNDKFFRVLVALDTSEASFNALKAIPALLDVDAIEVTLMHVIELPWARLDLPQDWSEYEPDASEISDYQRDLENELNRAADQVISRARDFLEARNISVTEIVDEGDPGLELVSHAEEGGYDLIVAGATGSSDVKHALLGSVSSKLAWNAPCSVLVVRS